MRRLFRPTLLVAVSAVAVVGAAAVVFQAAPPPTRPTPLPVAHGDCEVAWLYPATNAANWERFVTAVRRAGDRLRAEHPGLTVVDGPAAFPPQTTATPEAALAWPNAGRRLVFRWYKLTSDWKTRDWVEALLQRRPPPVAVIGGNSSDAARELACELRRAAAPLPAARRPVLLLTTATADRVPDESADAPVSEPPLVKLTSLYAGPTFRFCFTNEQMADAVTQFVWQRDDLRPDSDPVHVVRWNDDSYSSDLMTGFLGALQRLATREAAVDWLCATGCVTGGGPGALTAGGLPVRRAGRDGSGFRMALQSTPQQVDSSVGTFLTPNRFEAQAARYLLDLALDRPQRRPLLVVTGQAVPSRRFLRALVRLSPDYARRFVVATGDALSFNTVYRDRQVAWPVQDLPFPLVFFCHYDPVDPDAGFRYHRGTPDPVEVGTSTTGTEDVLLNGDIVEGLAQAFRDGDTFAGEAAGLAARLAELRLRDGRLGFDPAGRRLFREGDRHTGTGEHVVCLKPVFDGERVLPRAKLEVWSRYSSRETGPVWVLRGEPLDVSYGDAPPVQGGTP
jgi:hypothetical protein